MNSDLISAIKSGQLILFFGAGVSQGCLTKAGVPILDEAGLAKHLASVGGCQYDGEPLDEVYAAVRGKFKLQVDDTLADFFENTRPSADYKALASFAWRRVYTLNIDDALDSAFRKSRIQDVCVRISKDPILDQDNFFDRLDLIKLNGSVDRLGDGLVFSPSEYSKVTARSMPWYEQCASDFLRYPVLFIGTDLREPFLKFHIDRYKSLNNVTHGRSYVLVPSATELQKQALADSGLEYIQGTLSDFVSEINASIGHPLKPIDLAVASIPQLSELLRSGDARKFADLFDHVTPVKKSIFYSPLTPNTSIRDFYKGFKPTWSDVVEEIPARLDILPVGRQYIVSNYKNNSICPLIGPAGSGKTTVLMQLCLDISGLDGFDVFFIEQPIDNLLSTLEAIERSSRAPKVLVGIDNIDFVSDQLRDIFKSNRLQKTMIVGSERENIWKRKTRSRVGEFSLRPITVSNFSDSDARRILDKLQKYGSWTRLGQLSPDRRISELIDRAQKQLLIALLEATFGRGYGDIIASDFSSLVTEQEKLCFLVVGLITDRKHDAPLALVDRALSYIGILNRELMVSSHLSGIVVQRGGKLAVRHPIYVRYILDNLVDPVLTNKALSALLDVFSQYEAPVIKHVDKLEAMIYKGLINHAFLGDVLKGNRELVLSLYKSLEKKFEQDGLYWLQYGLALRDHHEHWEALEKLRTARQAYPMEHTLHALAQQLLIVAELCLDKKTAMNHVDEATEILENLDDVIESDDTFPIVTLAEGTTKVIRHHYGDEVARRKAGEFASKLQQRIKRLVGDDRLRKAYENMFRYAASGTWIDPEDL